MEQKKYEQKNNTGALFKNKDKTEETHSDYNGTGKINGTEYWINAWVNTSNAGTKYMQLKFSPKQTQSSVREEAGVTADPALDEELPF